MSVSNLAMMAAALKVFATVDPELPRQTMAVFIEVALNEGLTMKALTEQTGLSQASVSRNIAALSKVHRSGKPGYGLVVAVEDPEERRRKIVRLTPKGRNIAELLNNALNK